MLDAERYADSRIAGSMLLTAALDVLTVAEELSDELAGPVTDTQIAVWAVALDEDPRTRETVALLLQENLAGLLQALGYVPPPSSERLARDLQDALLHALDLVQAGPGVVEASPDIVRTTLRESLAIFTWHLRELLPAREEELDPRSRRDLRRAVRTGVRALLPAAIGAVGTGVLAALAPPAGALTAAIGGHAAAAAFTSAALSLAGSGLAARWFAPVVARGTREQTLRARLDGARQDAALVAALTEIGPAAMTPRTAAVLVTSLRVNMHMILATAPERGAARLAEVVLDALAHAVDANGVADPDLVIAGGSMWRTIADAFADLSLQL